MGVVKKILVNNGDRKKLCEMCNTTYPTVRVALDGKEKTPLDIKIRETALMMGGALREIVTIDKKDNNETDIN